MSEITTKMACAQARRKMAAAVRRLQAIPGLFGDLDGCLEREANDLVLAVVDACDRLDKSMQETVADQESGA